MPFRTPVSSPFEEVFDNEIMAVMHHPLRFCAVAFLFWQERITFTRISVPY
ncbi:MAG: hypothetical protein ACJASZ_002868 [Yoonia sp.]